MQSRTVYIFLEVKCANVQILLTIFVMSGTCETFNEAKRKWIAFYPTKILIRCHISPFSTRNCRSTIEKNVPGIIGTITLSVSDVSKGTTREF